MLRDAVHLRDRQADLLYTAALLVRRRGNLSHNIGYARHGRDDLFHGRTRLAHLFRAGIHSADRVLDKPFDLFCRLRAAAGQRPYFTCHDRKAATLFPGTGGFNRRVERQNVGLEGNAIDNAGDMRNLLRTVGNVIHGTHHVIHHLTASGGFRRILRQQRRLTGVIRVLFHRGSQLFHTGGGLFQRGCLLLGSRGKVVTPGGNFSCARVDRIGAAAHGADGAHQRLLHLVQTSSQLAHLVAPGNRDILRQIAARDGANMVHDGVERFQEQVL